MKKIVKIIILFSCLLSAGNLKSQLEFSKWYFGFQAGLDFSTSPPTALTNGTTNTLGGTASICDNSGNLLFYTDGTGIANSTHSQLANGSGLLGVPLGGNQPAIIVKQPGNTNLYYVFTTPFFPTQNIPAAYNVVDMTLAAGLGSVTVKNYTMYYSACSKQVAVKHCNGKDVWILSHEYNSNNFRAYLLTSSGLNLTPVISSAGEIINASLAGELKTSMDGKKLAMATAINNMTTNEQGGFFLFDFDAATGVVSNSLALLSTANCIGRAAGMEFSPDGTKLYGTSQTSATPVTSAIYQWDVCAASPSAIINSRYTYSVTGPSFGFVQRAINGKLYIACLGQQSISVINNPNAQAAAINFSLYGQSVAPKISTNCLPNYINGYFRTAPAPFANTINCQNVLFSVPPSPTFSSGCQATPFPAQGYLWDFGDVASGAANSSTLASPSHYYAALGTYSVSLILYNPCSNDTLKKTITISTPGPTPAISGSTLVCRGEKRTLTATGGSVYAWSNGVNTSTTAITPTQTTVYTCSATLNGCTLAKTFTVTVNPCLGIEINEKSSVKIFPNPVSGLLHVEVENPMAFKIYDLSGKLLLQRGLLPGENVIDLHELPAAVYIADVNGYYYRVVRMEGE
jgi:PKD repeat protein